MPENFIKKALSKAGAKGRLHRKLGIAAGTKIPANKLAKAAKSKSPALRKEVAFAKTLSKLRKRK